MIAFGERGRTGKEVVVTYLKVLARRKKRRNRKINFW